MGLFLQIAGGIFIIILLVILFILYRFWRGWKKFTTELTQSALPPNKIHLKDDPAPAWLDKEEVKAWLKRLNRSGFGAHRAYTIEEMQGTRLAALCHDKSGLCAVIYDHDQAGSWLDVVAKYRDGTGLTASNAPQGGEIDSPPESVKIFLPGATLDELIAAIKTNLVKKPREPLAVETFRETFEKDYEKEMSWRNERGGITIDEIERVAANMDEGIDRSTVEASHDVIKRREVDRHHVECLEEFKRTSILPEAKWLEYETKGAFIVLSKAFDPKAFAGYLCDRLDLPDEQAARFLAETAATESAPDVFKRLDRSSSPGLGTKKVGQVAKPVKALVLFVPRRGK